MPNDDDKKTMEEAKEEKKPTAVDVPENASDDKNDDSSDDDDAATQAPKKKSRKNKKRQVSRGKVFVHATYNNTIVTFTDAEGNALSQSSAGRCGFKGPKKATPFAAGIIVKDAAERVKDMGLKDVDIVVKGIGSGREGAIRAVNAQGFNMLSITDATPTPHNGCRPKKPRRV